MVNEQGDMIGIAKRFVSYCTFDKPCKQLLHLMLICR